MDRDGVRGIRVDIGQTVADARPRLEAAVQRVAGRDWHVNIAARLPMLEGLSQQLSESPVPIVIDHFAGSRASLGVQQPGFDVLLDLLRTGSIYVKVSRIHNVSREAPDYTDVVPLAKTLITANPQRILWATDWPHAGERPPGYSATDISPYKEIDDGRVFKTHIRSDNGPEFTAELIRRWLEALQVQTLFIEPGNPWENGYVESFNGKLRDELLDREIFYTLTEAQILIERWRRQYNTVRPHSALGYRPPAPEAVMPTPIGGLIMSPALS